MDTQLRNFETEAGAGKPEREWDDKYRTGSDSDRALTKRQWERPNVFAEPRSAYLLSGPARSE